MQRLQAAQSASKSTGSSASSASVGKWSRNVPRSSASELQGNLTEDQALARALQETLSASRPMTQEEMDREIAQALAASDEGRQPAARTQRLTNSCAMA